jgi:hypothetical protein
MSSAARAAGKIGSAAADIAKAASKAASAAASAAGSAAKSASKAAGAAAASAASAAKKAGKGAKKAGKGADAVGDAGSAAKKAGKGAKKAGKGADAVGDAGSAAKKGGKLGKGAKKAAPLLAAAGLVGGVLYIEKKLGEENEAVQGCATACLPSNFDELLYGDLKKDKLKYKTLEELKVADPKTPADQPLCSKEVKDCGEFCTTKCKAKHQSDIPGSKIMGRAGDAAGSVLNKINDAVNPFAGPEGKKRMLIAGIVLLLILLGPLLFKMMF